MPVTELKDKTHLPKLKQSPPAACWATCGSALSEYFFKAGCKLAKQSEQELPKPSASRSARWPASRMCWSTWVAPRRRTSKSTMRTFPPTRRSPTNSQKVCRFVVGISETQKLTNPKTEQLKDGHYMIITGVNDTTDKIEVMDPAGGNFVWTSRENYSENGYKEAHFCKTFYVDKPM